MDERASYEPTPEQIAAACAAIQSGWSESERESRLRGNVALMKYDAPNVEHDARLELDGKLADRRKALRQALRTRLAT